MSMEQAEIEQQRAEREADDNGFQTAVAAFAKDDPPPPTPPEPQPPRPVVEGDEPKAPEPETPPEEPGEQEPEAAAPTPEKPPEFVKFDKPEQLKRFNDVFGYAKRLERENEALRRQYATPPPQQIPPQQAAPAPTTQLQPFTEPKPKLANFQTTDDWEEAVYNWVERRQDYAASQIKQDIFKAQSVQEQQRQQWQQVAQREQFEQAKVAEGRDKFGLEFSNAAAELSNIATVDSVMYRTLFSLRAFPEVVMELGKNLQEADRIYRLSAEDQIYELKALEKKLIAKQALANKAQPKFPTKVEAPGAGEDQRPGPNMTKLRQAAKASGDTHDWAKVFAADPSM